MSEPELITIRQASDLTGKSVQYLNRLVTQGTLKLVTSQGKRKVSLCQVRELWPEPTKKELITPTHLIQLKEGFQQALKKRDDIIKDLQDRLSKQEAYMLEVCKEVYKGRINLVENQND